MAGARLKQSENAETRSQGQPMVLRDCTVPYQSDTPPGNSDIPLLIPALCKQRILTKAPSLIICIPDCFILCYTLKEVPIAFHRQIYSENVVLWPGLKRKGENLDWYQGGVIFT